jgi:hypothetical protein
MMFADETSWRSERGRGLTTERFVLNVADGSILFIVKFFILFITSIYYNFNYDILMSQRGGQSTISGN